MRNLKCAFIRGSLSASLDGALPARQAARVAAHLDTCPTCREEYEELRLTKAVLQIQDARPADPEFWPGLYARLEAQPQPPFWLRLRGAEPVWRGAALAGAAAAGLALGLLFFRPPAATPVVGAVDDVDRLVARHAEHSAAYPLTDWASLAYVDAALDGKARR